MKGIEKAFEHLVRGNASDLDAFLSTVLLNGAINDTKAVAHCHVLSLDGNGRPRVKDLAEFVANRVLEYAIPRSEIDKALKIDKFNNSTAAISKLKKKADGLFSEIKNAGEGGEVLLSILVQSILKLPQLLCKMPLKTNPNVHYHGVDGIHAKIDETTKTLALYWGESKLYKDMNSAITDCFESISKFLLPSGGSKDPKQRDLQLITGHLDLLDKKLEDAILCYLDKDHPSYNHLEYRAVCLVGFDYSKYPEKPNSKKISEILADVEKLTKEWNQKVSNKIKSIKNLETFEIHVFMLPFPSVQEFRDAFHAELGLS